MNEQIINIKKLNDKAIIPTYGTKYSAGADLYAVCDTKIEIKPQTMEMIKTGLAFSIKDGYVGLVFARSSLGTKKGLAPANKVGVIDSDYRGEVMVPLFNQSNEVQTIECGERIAQMIFVPYLKGNFNVVDELGDTTRGAGGFGSTNKKN